MSGSQKRTLLLVRHAHRADDGNQPSPGLGLAPLSAIGRRQAAAFAESLTERPDLIVVSSFVRSMETARPLCQRFAETPVETWPIHEFTFLPPKLFINTTIQDREPPTTAYWKADDPDLHPGPGGESFREFITRVDGTWHRFSQRTERLTVMISHGYTIQAMLWRLTTPGCPIGHSALSEWNQFRKQWHFPPTASVAIIDGVIEQLHPAPLDLMRAEICA